MVGVDRLAEIQLETMAVTGRPIVSRTTQKAAKLVHGWQRSAVWLRGDTVALLGLDAWGRKDRARSASGS